jgi:hypothetical protein
VSLFRLSSVRQRWPAVLAVLSQQASHAPPFVLVERAVSEGVFDRYTRSLASTRTLAESRPPRRAWEPGGLPKPQSSAIRSVSAVVGRLSRRRLGATTPSPNFELTIR